MNSLELNNLNINNIKRMIFIFNALEDGWTIKKLENKKYEFIKKNESRQEVNLEDFIRNNLQLNNIIK